MDLDEEAGLLAFVASLESYRVSKQNMFPVQTGSKTELSADLKA